MLLPLNLLFAGLSGRDLSDSRVAFLFLEDFALDFHHPLIDEFLHHFWVLDDFALPVQIAPECVHTLIVLTIGGVGLFLRFRLLRLLLALTWLGGNVHKVVLFLFIFHSTASLLLLDGLGARSFLVRPAHTLPELSRSLCDVLEHVISPLTAAGALFKVLL